MSNFPSSTHYKFWMFSTMELYVKRSNARDTALARLQNYIDNAKKSSQQQEESSLNQSTSPVPAGGKQLQAPTVEECMVLFRYYEFQISEMCKIYPFPDAVQATATVYFKRFFLSHSPIDYELKIVALTCIYMAAKVEEMVVNVDDLVRKFIVAEAAWEATCNDILATELVALTALNFHLIVFHPYRPLLGFIHHAQELKVVDGARAKQVYEGARVYVRNSLFTDLSCGYSPSQIAAAALHLAAADLSVDISQYFVKAFGEQTEFGELMTVLEEVEPILVTAGAPPQREVASDVDKKLRRLRRGASDMEKASKARSDGDQDDRRLRKTKLKAAKEEADAAALLGAPQHRPTDRPSMDDDRDFVLAKKKRRDREAAAGGSPLAG